MNNREIDRLAEIKERLNRSSLEFGSNDLLNSDFAYLLRRLELAEAVVGETRLFIYDHAKNKVKCPAREALDAYDVFCHEVSA